MRQTSKLQNFADSPRYRYLYSCLELIPEEVSEVSSREPIVAGSLEPRLLAVALDNALHEINGSGVELSRGGESKRNETNNTPFLPSSLPQSQVVEQLILPLLPL